MQWGDLARCGDFRRLWLGDAISLLGDWFTYVAVGMLALESGGGLTSVAMVLVAHTLPRALFAPYAGRLADRYDRRAIMVVVSLLRALIVVGMVIAAYFDQLFAVQALLFVRMALGAFMDPAAQASLPQLLPLHLLGRANALLGATWSLVFTIGVGLGGLVTAAIGVVGALAVDAVTFVVAAGILATLPRLRPEDRPPTRVAGGGELSWHVDGGQVGVVGVVGVVGNVGQQGDGNDGGEEGRREASAGDGLTAAVEGHQEEVDQGRLRDAWRIVLQQPLVLEAALAKVPIMLVGGGAWILLHGVAEGLGTVALALGALHSARGIGTGIGPLVWARSSRLASARLGLSVGTWLTFAGVALFALASAPTWVFVAVGLWGFGTGAGWVTSATRVQILTPRPILGRVASIDQLGLLLSQGLAGLVGALIADASGSAQDAAWFGLAAGIVAWAGLAVVVRRGLAKSPGSPPEGGELTPSGGRSTQRSDRQSS